MYNFFEILLSPTVKLAKPLGISLIPSLCGGIGTYELLRVGSQGSYLGVFQKTITVPQDDPLYDDEDAKIPTDPQKTYLETFMEEKLTVVGENTTKEQLENILLGRMFPNYRKEHKQSANQLFTGSPEIKLSGTIRKNSVGREMFILGKNVQKDLDGWKRACVAALNKKPTDPNNHSQKYRLKEWCTVSTVRKVLLRHKFRMPTSEEQWKDILKSEWITNNRYSNKQSFLTGEELTKLNSAEVDVKDKISTLKGKCDVALSREFSRTNFPAPRDFLDTLSEGDKRVDEFQEAALLCTIPVTAEKYVQEAMKGTIHASLPTDMANDYCYDADKSIGYYRNIKTTDPMEGKSFWCAVRVIYHRNEFPNSTGN